MCAELNRGQITKLKLQPSSILASLQELSFSGNVMFEFFLHENLVSALTSVIELHKDIPSFETHRLVTDAVHDCCWGEKKTVSEDDFLLALRTVEREYLRRRRRVVHAVFTLSVAHSRSVRRRRLRGCDIRFSAGFPRKYERKNLVDAAHQQVAGELPSDYTPVIVRISVRSPSEAAERVVDTLDLLRGIWILALSYGQYTVASSWKLGSWKNPVQLGPIATFHREDGSPAGKDAFWTRTDYHGPSPLKQPSDFEWSRIQAGERFIRGQLQKSPMSGRLEMALRRYARALDDPDWFGSFLKLWSLLEYLTGEQSPTDVRVRRLLSPRGLATTRTNRILARFLCGVRNELVHEEPQAKRMIQRWSLLRLFLEQLLLTLILYADRFQSFDEALRFLDLPANLDELNRRKELLELAIRFRE